MKVLAILAFVWFSGQSPLNFSVSRHADPVVEIAADMMQDDLEEVTGIRPVETAPGKAGIRIIQYDKDRTQLGRLGVPADIADSLTFVKEAFYIGTHDGQIIVAGSDARGTAYGILEISRLPGVSANYKIDIGCAVHQLVPDLLSPVGRRYGVGFIVSPGGSPFPQERMCQQYDPMVLEPD